MMHQFLTVLVLACITSAQTWGSNLLRNDSTYTQHLNLVYGPAEGNGNLLDLYLPVNHSADTRLVVFVHGGSWKRGSKNDLPKMLVSILAARGYGVASLNYRLMKNGKDRYPVQLEDLGNAFTFLSARAAEYKYNGKEFALMGASAGAHLSLLYTYALDKEKRIKTIIDIVGPVDLTDKTFRFRPSGESTVSEYLNNDDPDAAIAREASPIYHLSVKTGVPTIIFHGEEDELVPVEQAKALYKKHQQLGIRTQIELYPGETHEMRKSLISIFTKVVAWLQEVFPAG